MSYGKDTYCYDRVFTGRYATGVEVLAQALYRRLTTARGTLDDGEEGAIYGLDVADFIGRVGTANAADAVPPVIDEELSKDDRVESVDVTAAVEQGADGMSSVTIDIDVFPHAPDQPFTMSISVAGLTVALLGVTPL